MANGKPGRPATGRRKYWYEGVTGKTRAQAIYLFRADEKNFKSITNILRLAMEAYYIKHIRAGWKLPDI